MADSEPTVAVAVRVKLPACCEAALPSAPVQSPMTPSLECDHCKLTVLPPAPVTLALRFVNWPLDTMVGAEAIETLMGATVTECVPEALLPSASLAVAVRVTDAPGVVGVQVTVRAVVLSKLPVPAGDADQVHVRPVRPVAVAVSSMPVPAVAVDGPETATLDGVESASVALMTNVPLSLSISSLRVPPTVSESAAASIRMQCVPLGVAS